MYRLKGNIQLSGRIVRVKAMSGVIFLRARYPRNGVVATKIIEVNVKQVSWNE